MNAGLHGVAVSFPMPLCGEGKEENEADGGKANSGLTINAVTRGVMKAKGLVSFLPDMENADLVTRNEDGRVVSLSHVHKHKPACLPLLRMGEKWM